jgi:hypothetical protein
MTLIVHILENFSSYGRSAKCKQPCLFIVARAQIKVPTVFFYVFLMGNSTWYLKKQQQCRGQFIYILQIVHYQNSLSKKIQETYYDMIQQVYCCRDQGAYYVTRKRYESTRFNIDINRRVAKIEWNTFFFVASACQQ